MITISEQEILTALPKKRTSRYGDYGVVWEASFAYVGASWSEFTVGVGGPSRSAWPVSLKQEFTNAAQGRSHGMDDKIVRTERFELVDRHGRPRAVLACEEDSGAPTCAFLDAEGPAEPVHYQEGSE